MRFKAVDLGNRIVSSMRFKAVIFDVGGVLVPQPQIAIRQYEKDLGTPPGFLGQVFMKGAPDNSFSRVERGELLFSEFLDEFGKEVASASEAAGIQLHGFSAKTLFEKMEVLSAQALHHEMFHAIKILKSKDMKTCALTNNWIDEREKSKEAKSKFMNGLRRFFDAVIESAIEGVRKPDENIYKIACERLEVNPSEVIFLDDIGKNLKPASELGITCIKVESPVIAVKKLEELVGYQLLPGSRSRTVYPPPCKPDDVPHAVATLKSGIKMHYVDVGEGPAVFLFHGFPDLWYGWRYQIPALASAGYRVIAMDQRGYGDSSAPYPINDYLQQKACRDAIDLMDFMGISQATIIGHDWGGAVVWNLALYYPHKFTAVCSITTPFFTGEGAKRLASNIQVFDYQKYFRQEGIAEKELEGDLIRVFKLFYRGVNDVPVSYPDGKKADLNLTNVTKRGGVMVGYPQDIPRGKLLSEVDLAYYVKQFQKSGFRGPLNWYRNTNENISWQSKLANRKIFIPSLMITASDDVALRPEFSLGMEDRIPNLERVDLKDCSHWAHIEKADEVNDALIHWLDKIHKRQSKL